MQDEQELRANSYTQRLDTEGYRVGLVNLDLEHGLVFQHQLVISCGNSVKQWWKFIYTWSAATTLLDQVLTVIYFSADFTTL